MIVFRKPLIRTLLASALAFGAAGPALADPPAPAGDTIDLDDPANADATSDVMTPWLSGLMDDMDHGLIGTWRLASAYIVANGKTIQHPSDGRTLTINADGSYVEEYATEKFGDTITISPGILTPTLTVEWPDPRDYVDPGISGMLPAPCKDTGVFSGRVVGQLWVPFDVDLDAYEEGVRYLGLPWLQVRPDMAASQKPQVVCPGAAVDVTASAASPPLGKGRANNTTDHGMVVEYDYALNEDLNFLRIRSRSTPRVVLYFVKQ